MADAALEEEDFVELNDMLDKLLLSKYADVLARAGLSLPKLLELQRSGEAEKRLQRCGIFKGPRDAIVAELRLRHMTGSSPRSAAPPPSAPAAVDTVADTLEMMPSERRRLWPGVASATTEGINGPTLERRRRATAPHLMQPSMFAQRAAPRQPLSLEPNALGKIVSAVRNVVDGTSGPDSDGGDVFYKADGTLRESTPARSGGALSGGTGTIRFSEDSPLWAPPRAEPTGEDLLDRLFKMGSDRHAELRARDKAAVDRALAVMAAKATQHRPTAAAGGTGSPTAVDSPQAPLLQGVVVDADAAGISYMGRFDRRLSKAVRFDWPGSTISVRFRGSSSIAMRLAGAGNFYSVTVDECMSATIYADDESDKDPVLHKIADGLAIRRGSFEGPGDDDQDEEDDEEESAEEATDEDEQHHTYRTNDDDLVIHTLTIVKRTEAIGSSFLTSRDSSARVATFFGFLLDPGAEILPPLTSAEPGRKVLFLGDDETAGFGNESQPGRRVPDPTNSNAAAAYSAVCAKLLNAEHHNISWSGKGVVHNAGDFSCWDGRSDRPLPFYLDRTCASSSEPSWDFCSWLPDAVVVLLGGNDFATARRPSLDIFAAGYDELLRKLRHQYPLAHIFACSCDPNLMPTGQRDSHYAAELSRTLDDVVSLLNDPRVVRQRLRLNGVELIPGENFGAMGHWNAEIHAAVAVELAVELRWRLRWDIGDTGSSKTIVSRDNPDELMAQAAKQMVPDVW
ncbi:GDSL-type esterase/lipase family protein [bacterium]|nr:GDSL-type esterase/lipase family protein [bacterium]